MKKNRFSKHEVLKEEKQFNELFCTGKVIHGNNVTIIYHNAEEFKIGFTVSKKIKGHVKKNKLKRQLREIYRTHKAVFPQNVNLIIMAKKFGVEFSELKNEILLIVKTI